MKFNQVKNLLLILTLQFICGYAFTQVDPEPIPMPPEPKPVTPPQEVIYEIVEEEAEFPGGKKAMLNYLAENLKYPESAIELGVQGRCYVKFVVSAKGQVYNVKVLKGVTDCPGCDKEVVRVIKTMPKWKPGRVNGKDVDSYYRLPVTVNLR